MRVPWTATWLPRALFQPDTRKALVLLTENIDRGLAHRGLHVPSCSADVPSDLCGPSEREHSRTSLSFTAGCHAAVIYSGAPHMVRPVVGMTYFLSHSSPVTFVTRS